MPLQNLFKKITQYMLHGLLSVKEENQVKLDAPGKILIIRQHNQFGDLLASVSLFRAVKETFPNSKLTIIVSPENHFAVEKNEFIDEMFIFDKREIVNPFYVLKLKKVLKQNYDLAIVPATVAISKTSCLLAAFSDAKLKVGPHSLDGVVNPLDFVFHQRVKLNWKKNPDAHVSDFTVDIVRPLGINTRNFKSSVKYDDNDMEYASKFLESLNINENDFIIGFHIGAGKPPNRWPLEKFIKLIYLLNNYHPIKIYFTGSDADREEINYIQSNLGFDAGYFLNKTIPQLTALISQSNLFITNDTGVMHVAGATETPQISIFGPTNPFNWAPLGNDKYFLRKSELIADVMEDEVFNLCKYILDKRMLA